MNKLVSSLRTMMSVVVLAVIAPTALAAPAYRVIDLGTLGGSLSGGYGINDAGQVTGGSYTSSGEYHAFLYSKGTMIDLGTLGGIESHGWGINNAGQVSGSSTTPSGQFRAFLYSNGTMADLGTLGGSVSYGYGINDAGQVTGWSRTDDDPNVRLEHAFVFSNGTMIDLGTLGGYDSYGVGINNSGHVTGSSGLYSTHGGGSGFLYGKSSMTDLGIQGTGYGINDADQVTGVALTSSGMGHAFLHNNGAMTDLGTLGGWSSIGYCINNAGQVTGKSELFDPVYESSGYTHAFLYSGGTMIDLNSLIDPNSGWTLEGGGGINNVGQITGWGSINGAEHAFLLTPIPEPEIYAMLITGLGMLGLLARRRLANA